MEDLELMYKYDDEWFSEYWNYIPRDQLRQEFDDYNWEEIIVK